MAAYEVLTGFSTAPGATLTALTMSAGQSNVVRNFQKGESAYIVAAWQRKQGIGNFRILSTNMHDAVNGINLRQAASTATFSPVYNQIPYGAAQPLVAQETVTLQTSGSAVAGDLENAAVGVYYTKLDGSNGLFIDSSTLALRSKNLLTIQQAIVAGTAGGWSGSQALSAAASGDLLKANTYYAILGFIYSATAPDLCAIGYVGPDTGNLVVGGPAAYGDPGYTSRWFIELSDALKRPLIPVINSANKGATFCQVVNDENANTATIGTILAELA